MSIRRLCMALIVLMALVAPVNAQDEMTNTLTFNNLSLSFEATLATGVTVEQVAATPVSDNQPFFESAPAHTQFTLLNYAGLVDDPSAAILQPRLQMFNTADFAQYSFFADQLAQLETLLKDQPDLSPYMAASMPGQSAENLPYLPAVNAAQVFRAHAHYLETGDWRMITGYLKQVFRKKNIVGFDIVEFAPIRDLKAPGFLVAKLYYKLLSYKFHS